MQCLSCSSEKIYCPYIVYDSAGKLEEIQPTGCFHARNGQLLNADSVRSFCKSVGTPLVAINVAPRMDYDTTALPWFLVPRWNTSAWGEYITHFGPQGVLDHKARGHGAMDQRSSSIATGCRRFEPPRLVDIQYVYFNTYG